MKIPEPEILTTTCAMTVIGGEIVFEAESRAATPSRGPVGRAGLESIAGSALDASHSEVGYE